VNLPEVRESEAPPAVAATYAALREATGVPLVNLIWRHLASLDGALPWAWATIAPALRSGLVAGARDRLAAGLALPSIPAISPEQWRATGLNEAQLQAVRDLVAVYNRGNQTNLVLLTALRRYLAGDPPFPGPAQPSPVGAMLPASPPLPKLAELPPDTAALVQALGARHDAAASGIIPSLWLHLAHWPALLSALPGWLGPMLEPDVLRATRHTAMALAEHEGDALRPHLTPPGEPSQRAAILSALTTFTTLLIPDMVPVGLALERVLPTPT
jgi:hypothetical protein